MSFLGNLLWLLSGGILVSLTYALVGLVLCLSIIGIPIGLQSFKLAALSFAPFGRSLQPFERNLGHFSIVVNAIWLVVVGIEIASVHLVCALLCALTIIGIPFAVQHVKLASLALWPFGRAFHDT
jgi:uncharacterized membrane protein YccF (DUF307 family)